MNTSSDSHRHHADADMAILHNLGIETEAVYHNARPGTLYDEVPQHAVSQGMRSNPFVSKETWKHGCNFMNVAVNSYLDSFLATQIWMTWQVLGESLPLGEADSLKSLAPCRHRVKLVLPFLSSL